MSEPQTPEEARAKIVAELKARPGPKPLKPIPPEIMAEILAADQMSYEEAVREYQALLDGGGCSIEPYLEELKRKYTDGK
jgi:hypothetical protein